ncbi:hypothetical protein [Jatrophihabitans sp.]|uniref:hypothetical protein n=1 Tax=Jatrophihabitans sp. TaxID=1932789 RepID=UPI002CB85643|nr:hypothetical protein [Jatrophihabitans sp.]
MNIPQDGGGTVTMWEVRAADGQLEPLLAWVQSRLGGQARVYRSSAGEPRVVVLDPTGEVTGRLAGIPAALVARPPHAWQFELVGNGAAGPAHLDE